jgi:hypothetical protein
MIAILETLIEKKKGYVIDEFLNNLNKIMLGDAKSFRGDLYKFVNINGPSYVEDFYKVIALYGKKSLERLFKTLLNLCYNMNPFQNWDRNSMEEIHTRFEINIKLWGEDEDVFE